MIVFTNRSSAECWVQRQAVHAAAAGAMSIRISPDRLVAILKVHPSLISWESEPGERFKPVYRDDRRVWPVVISPESAVVYRKEMSGITRGMAVSQLAVAA